MYDAQYIFKDNTVYGPWMGRSGDSVQVYAELVEQSVLDVKIELFHKNSEDPGNGTAVSVDVIDLDSVDYASQEWSGLKELVRFKVSTVNGISSSDYGLFRMLSHVWFDDVRA